MLLRKSRVPKGNKQIEKQNTKKNTNIKTLPIHKRKNTQDHINKLIHKQRQISKNLARTLSTNKNTMQQKQQQ